MADGAIEFSTRLDNSDLEKGLKEAEKLVDSLKKKLEKTESGKSAIEAEMDGAKKSIAETEAAIDALRKKLDELRADTSSGKVHPLVAKRQEQVYETRIGELTQSLEEQQATLDGLTQKWGALDDEAASYKERIADAQKTVDTLGKAAQSSAAKSTSVWRRAADAIRSRVAAMASGIRASFSNAIVGLGKLMTMVRRFASIAIAATGLYSLGSRIGQIAMQNEQFTASVANLSAVVDGFAVEIASAILPALTAFVGFLASALQSIAGLIDSVFGTSIVSAIQGVRNNASASIQASNAEAVAMAEEKQAKAAKKLAKEQEKANNQLMSFDELNVLAEESTDAATDAIDDYSDGVWVPVLTTDWTQLDTPDLGIFQGILDWLEEIKRRILNDIEGPFARIREGLELIKQGWDKLVNGVMSGDWAAAWDGVRDIVIGVLYVIEGALTAFLDWLNEATGGRLGQIIEGIKGILHGVVDFIEGVLRGDLDLALRGLHEIVTGALGAALGVTNLTLDGIKEGVSAMFTYIGDKVPALKPIMEAASKIVIDVVDGLKEFISATVEWAESLIQGSLDILVGVVTLDMDRIKNGVDTLVKGTADYVHRLFNDIRSACGAAVNWIRSNVINPIGSFVGNLANNISSAFGNAWGNVQNGAWSAWDSIRNAFGGVADFLTGVFRDAWEGVKSVFMWGGQIFDGVVDAITNAFRWLLNNIIDGLNWALAQPFWGINDIISALNSWNFNGFYPFSFWTVPVPQIPYLAGGAVIPPNREFMAVLGDQANGRNLEAPESLIRQIVREESGDGRVAELLSELIETVQRGQSIYVDRTVLGKTTRREFASQALMGGGA